MNPAAIALLALVFVLVAFDWMTLRGKNRRALLLETGAFVTGAFFILFPHRATSLAHLVGIGRGVDFLLYPIVIWLVRESLQSRRRHHDDAERMTQVVRALAIAEARTLGHLGYGDGRGDQSIGRYPSQSPSASASITE